MMRCSYPGCVVEHKDDKWNKMKAQETGWFSQRSGESWCPAHVPDWVQSWREKQQH